MIVAIATIVVVLVAVLATVRWVRLRRHPWLGKFLLGSVYVFRDKGYPGIVKIGMTGQLCRKRKGQVSRTMADGAALAQVYALDHVPFPRAVERLAHRTLKRHRVRWPKGSKRGIEWFYVPDGRALEKVIGAIERAAHRVRTAARKKGRWPVWADARVSVWRLEGGKVRRYRLFHAQNAVAKNRTN
jgi:hypothetical protein